MGTGTSSAKYSTDGLMLGNSSDASFENIISLHTYRQKNTYKPFKLIILLVIEIIHYKFIKYCQVYLLPSEAIHRRVLWRDISDITNHSTDIYLYQS